MTIERQTSRISDDRLVELFTLGELYMSDFIGEGGKVPPKVPLTMMLDKKSGLFKSVHSISHITGGGFYDNIERLLPSKCDVIIDKSTWKVPEIFNVIRKKGNIAEKEIYRVLNMGIGLILLVDAASAKKVMKYFKGARVIGKVVKGSGKVHVKLVDGEWWMVDSNTV